MPAQCVEVVQGGAGDAGGSRGHLGVGACADITVYEDLADREAMFATPVFVFKNGEVIVRGGKNISAVRVEEEVASHPAVALVAAVAYPDELFGERVCVYLQLVPETSITLEELIDHLERRGTSKEIRPERLIVLEELPRASGGKVAKGELRADARRRAGREDNAEVAELLDSSGSDTRAHGG